MDLLILLEFSYFHGRIYKNAPQDCEAFFFHKNQGVFFGIFLDFCRNFSGLHGP